MTGQWKVTKNNIRQIEFNIYGSLSIDMKTQFSPHRMIFLTSSKNMEYSFYSFLTKPTIVKRFYINFSKIIPNWKNSDLNSKL